ncbi:MAG TPA: HlyD family efflux transporter periplasmic adaptor subunit [Bacteroidia bacterium]|nr:HlyD family efflux transporter periplasmic adaptor subunit [Bacteroidia bacterium]
MDRVIEKKKWPASRIAFIAGILLFAAFVLYTFLFSSGGKKLNVEGERISISEVKQDDFREYIPVNGLVLPVTSIYLDALEGGRVEEKFVEDGAQLKKGDAILRLSNTDLELSLANEQTAVFNVLTQMQNTKNNAEQNSINRQTNMADIDNALKEAERIYNTNKKLFDDKVIAEQDFKSTENLYNYQVTRKKLAEDIMKQDGNSMKQQVVQMKESYERMQHTLALMQRKVGDLIVRAPVDGQITSLDAEYGQSINKGQRLGQIDVMSGFKVRAEIDEHYISRVFPDLQGEILLGEKTYHLKIKKVYSQVSNGRFQVDLVFIDAVPQNIRRGQTLQIRLALGDETKALLVNKGGFYQQTGGNWAFKLSADGKKAYKVDMQVGRQNPDYYEILSGLKSGDKIITSSYETFGDMEELEIK